MKMGSERTIKNGLVYLICLCTLVLSSLTSLEAFASKIGANVESKYHPRNNTFMKRKWGVELLYVRQTAAGYMLEFRYKVLDPDKSKSLFERQTKPILTHVESGAKLIVPTPAKTGALRNSNDPLVDHTYWMFFANPGKLVKVGDHVNIAIGDFKTGKIVVQ